MLTLPSVADATILLLVRHGATEANLCQPPRIQGNTLDLPLAPLGARQAEATRDVLASWRISHCYTSPLLRAVQTAAILATPHGISPVVKNTPPGQRARRGG